MILRRWEAVWTSRLVEGGKIQVAEPKRRFFFFRWSAESWARLAERLSRPTMLGIKWEVRRR